MSKNDRHISLSTLLLMGIFLCTIVCSVTASFGNIGTSQDLVIARNDVSSSRITAQLAEKAETESETDSKNQVPLFVIQTVVQAHRLDFITQSHPRPLNATRPGNFLTALPLYLVDRTIRI